MKEVSMHEAKTHLSKLVQEALAGEEVVITNRNQPMVRLQVVAGAKPQRQFGGLKSLVEAMGPSFDEPLDDFADYAPAVSLKVAEDSPEYRA
ncbi:MAG: type II toxin-antitoxin system Phd/YefM family antitoxin [Akkermansiaceae bacterium]|nr:type II toxin-antitoxin system Phd/YefM family antitoxin [Akkermansiaceae bacterium]MCP5546209.1 type II toxin-antitoxin system Phd/YefM family antitoxin [Akkermansiaceae bacterium]